MPKSKPLTDAAIAQLKPGLQPYKRTDGGTPGLHLWVSSAGTKTWRFRYQRDKREYVMTLGHYQPKVAKHHMSLDRARSEAYRLKAEIRAGAHPAEDRNREREPDKFTFEYVAKEYIEYFLHGTAKKRKPAASTAAYTQRALKACKPLHDRGIADIKPSEFQEVIFKQVKDENFESARKIRSFLNKTCAYAYGMGWIARNPIPGLPRPPTPGDTEKGFAAILEPEAFGKLLRIIEAYDGNKIIKTALQILPHIFVRPGELRFATWREINFKKTFVDDSRGADEVK